MLAWGNFRTNTELGVQLSDKVLVLCVFGGGGGELDLILYTTREKKAHKTF